MLGLLAVYAYLAMNVAALLVDRRLRYGRDWWKA